MNHDSSWYALRNAIYAEGCRSVTPEDQTRSFSSVQAEATRYFENAISVLTDLLFTPNGLMAVQALVVMVIIASSAFISQLQPDKRLDLICGRLREPGT